MSDAIISARPGKAAVVAKPAQTLRDAKPKSLPPSSLKPLGYGETEILTLTVPTEWTFEDVLNPLAWTIIAGPIAANASRTQTDRVGSLVYVNTADGSFIAWLRINKIVRDHMNGAAGVEVICIGPSIDLKTGRPAPLNLKTGLPWSDPAKPAPAAAA
jgi:hypothetical protein